MTNGPLISIVIPSKNQAAYLEIAMRSVLDQSYRRVELIVMDGGSTDGSIEVVGRHAAQLAHWSTKADEGPAAALNEGFEHASGEVLGFLNADDFLLPGALDTVARAFATSPAVDVFSGHGYFASPAGALGAPMSSDRWNLTRFRYGACVLLQPATFFRRAAFDRAGGVPQSGRVCWDMELWAALATSGARFETLNANLAAFRLHPGSLTANPAHQQRRKDDARAVSRGLNGGSHTFTDQLARVWFRALKFARHPIQAVRRRAYFYGTLKRWSL
jgi:glycosyltransferase involved in cell wall biosynthesis